MRERGRDSRLAIEPSRSLCALATTLVITLPPEREGALNELARQEGVAPEALGERTAERLPAVCFAEFQCRGTKTMVNHRTTLEIFRNPVNRERRADHI